VVAAAQRSLLEARSHCWVLMRDLLEVMERGGEVRVLRGCRSWVLEVASLGRYRPKLSGRLEELAGETGSSSRQLQVGVGFERGGLVLVGGVRRSEAEMGHEQ
jgi:hypothetical protein